MNSFVVFFEVCPGIELLAESVGVLMFFFTVTIAIIYVSKK